MGNVKQCKEKCSCLCWLIVLVMLSVLSAGCELYSHGISSIRLKIGGLPKEVVNKPVTNFSSPVTSILFSQAPAGIRSISLSITGPEMSIQTYYYDSVPASISLEVPAGKAREFTLYVNLDPTLPVAVLAYKGKATTDLKPGESKELNLTMELGETKIVIPDTDSDNPNGGRLVQVNNMRGDGWIERSLSDLAGISGRFHPSDVDFDASGRIYVSNTVGYYGGQGAPMSYLFRLDNMQAAVCEDILQELDYDFGITSFAIDRKKDILYYMRNNALNMHNIKDGQEGPIASPPPGPGFEIKHNVAVADNGMLYITGETNGKGQIAKYDVWYDAESSYTYKGATVKSYSMDIFLTDILVKDDYVLVMSPGNYENNSNKIVKFDLDLNLIGIYGSSAELDFYDNRRGVFYGPSLFVGILNRQTLVLDAGSNYNNYNPNRLITFEDPKSWYNWSVLRGEDVNKTPFRFNFVNLEMQ